MISKIYECAPILKEPKKDFSNYPPRKKLTKREIRHQNKVIQKQANLIMKFQGLSGQLIKVAKAKELIEKWLRVRSFGERTNARL